MPLSIRVEIPGTIRPWARTGGGKGTPRFTPAKQRNYMGAIQTFVTAAMAKAGAKPHSGSVLLMVRAVYQYPKSWSAKKRAKIKWKTSKPDADNIVKIVKDALNKIAWTDDAVVAAMMVQKHWGETERLVISFVALEDDAKLLDIGD
jgi:Holliday junction resolvase RusA-like endonuclease